MPNKIKKHDEFIFIMDSQYHFQQITRNAYTYMDTMTYELGGFHCYLVEPKSCKCTLTQ